LCHTSIPALPNLTKFEVIKGLAITDGAVDISSLTRISHIHLFGIAFIFFLITNQANAGSIRVNHQALTSSIKKAKGIKIIVAFSHGKTWCRATKMEK
jgi:hypothetical protein